MLDLNGLDSLTKRDSSQAFENIEQAKMLIGQILDHLPLAIFWKDIDLVFRGCNGFFAESVGLENAVEIIGKTDYDLPCKTAEAEFYQACDRKVIETGCPLSNIEETQRRADGVVAWIRTSKAPILNKCGEVVGVLGIFSDITKEKDQAEALRKTNESILKTQEYLVQQEKLVSLGSVFKGLVEEIASPAAMLDNLARVQKGLVKEAVGEWKALGLETSDCLEDLSHNAGLIIDYSTSLIESAKRIADKELSRSLVPSNLTISTVLQETIKLIQETMTLKDIQIVLSEYDDSSLYGIRLELERVILNLINNAIEAIEVKQKKCPDHKGLIIVTLKQREDMIVLTVEDNGIGITPEDSENIFLPFFTTKPLGSGHQGLGLSVCQSIIYKKYGGEISVQSFQEGSRFLVAIPC